MLTFSQINFDQDLNQVVSLIKLDLNPDMTLSFFRNKHLRNPFGQSLGIVARENEEIVGVRMGLHWEFICAYLGRKIRSIRPVDTVVSRKYRKQGIFTKMNLELMKIIENEDYDLIFNTPNENSLPANIRMGWEILENRNNYKLGVLKPFHKVVNFREILPSQINFKVLKTNELYFHTNYKDNFFEWRYREEMGEYKVASFNKENSNCVIYNTTVLKGLNTVIIYDLLGDENFFSTMVTSLGISNNNYFIYFIDNASWKKVNFLYTFTRNRPNVLFRNDRYSIIENIIFSIGDFEAVI